MNHDQHPALALLSELLDHPSPPGWEEGVASVVRGKLAGWGYSPETDAAGNVFVRLPGRSEGPLLCCAAHMDEIAVVVTGSEADGSLRVIRSGGLFPWKLGETPVEILGDAARVTGVVSMGSGHSADRSRALDWPDVRVITGLTPEQLAAAGVRPGSPVVPVRSMRGPLVLGDPADPLVAAWTFDDRMGVVTLLRLLQALAGPGAAQLALPTVIAFTVREEVGGYGAKFLAQRLRPDIFLAVDGSPITPGSGLAIDGRPAAWANDRLGPYSPKLVQALRKAGQAVGVDVQTVAYATSASDASMATDAGMVGQAACFGHVRENSHGYEVARLAVFDNMLRVLQHVLATDGALA